jgi:hypothetical protein
MPDHHDARCDEDNQAAVWDDFVLGGLLSGLGGLRVLIAFAEHERFATEATLAAIATLVGILVLIAAATRHLTPS